MRVNKSQSCNATSSFCRGFLWRDGAILDLGSLGGTQTNPQHINDQGEIVGASRSATPNRAFLWDKGVMVDLNTLIPANSGWVLLQANCINASGQIVGNGLLNGQARGFLLTPQHRPLR